MSRVLGLTGAPQMTMVYEDDRRAAPIFAYELDFRGNYIVGGDASGFYADWTKPCVCGGAFSVGTGMMMGCPFVSDVRWSGASQRLRITGTTRNLAGAVLGGCTVKAYRTTDDVVEDTYVSSNEGYYELFVASSGTYYIVGYLAGSPDVAGTTIHGLTGV